MLHCVEVGKHFLEDQNSILMPQGCLSLSLSRSYTWDYLDRLCTIVRNDLKFMEQIVAHDNVSISINLTIFDWI